MMMPVMTGGQLLATLAKGGRLEGLPVVVVSANADLAETTGARLVMAKPVSLDQILAVADSFCDHRAGAQG